MQRGVDYDMNKTKRNATMKHRRKAQKLKAKKKELRTTAAAR